MPAVLHHRDGEVDRMADVTQARGRPDAQAIALHHTGVELNLAVGVEAGADARVEQGLVLHAPNGRNRRRERAFADAPPALVPGALHRCLTIPAFVLRYGSRAAVDDQGRAGQMVRGGLVGQRFGVGPKPAALDKATLGDPALKGGDDPSVGGGPLRAAALAKPPLHADPAIGLATLRAPFHLVALDHFHRPLLRSADASAPCDPAPEAFRPCGVPRPFARARPVRPGRRSGRSPPGAGGPPGRAGTSAGRPSGTRGGPAASSAARTGGRPRAGWRGSTSARGRRSAPRTGPALDRGPARACRSQSPQPRPRSRSRSPVPAPRGPAAGRSPEPCPAADGPGSAFGAGAGRGRRRSWP